MSNLVLSSLGKTWLIDIDGTIVKHNGHLIDGQDTILEGVKETWEQFDEQDHIVLLTARKACYAEQLEHTLNENGIRFDQIIYDLPHGERVLINDKKPSGLMTAYAVNKDRDRPLDIGLKISPEL